MKAVMGSLESLIKSERKRGSSIKMEEAFLLLSRLELETSKGEAKLAIDKPNEIDNAYGNDRLPPNQIEHKKPKA